MAEHRDWRREHLVKLPQQMKILFFKDYNLGMCFSICDIEEIEAQMS